MAQRCPEKRLVAAEGGELRIETGLRVVAYFTNL
jgi:hypothetical protein